MYRTIGRPEKQFFLAVPMNPGYTERQMSHSPVQDKINMHFRRTKNMYTLLAAAPAAGDTFPAKALIIVGVAAAVIAVASVAVSALKKKDDDDE